MKRMITLITDFGAQDEYAGVMKGVILSINRNARIVDITHQIEPQDVVGAAITLNASFRYFPKGSIHVVVVDPGVGTNRNILALSVVGGHFFIAPDNGVLTPVIETEKIEAVIRVENASYFRKPVSRTFHGRDIFAPVAAHLTRGTPLTDLGPSVDLSSLVRLEIQKSYEKTDRELIGTIIWIDRFGNLITNIHEIDVKNFMEKNPRSVVAVILENETIVGLSDSYQGVEDGKPVAVIGSRGYLEVAIRCGNASQYFTSERGDSISVVFRPPVSVGTDFLPPKSGKKRKVV